MHSFSCSNALWDFDAEVRMAITDSHGSALLKQKVIRNQLILLEKIWLQHFILLGKQHGMGNAKYSKD